NIQTLGMPMSLASLTGLAGGPMGAVTIWLLGWLSDKGSGPNRRKMLNVLLSGSIMTAGCVLVVLANVMHLHAVRDGAAMNCSSMPMSNISLPDLPDGSSGTQASGVQGITNLDPVSTEDPLEGTTQSVVLAVASSTPDTFTNPTTVSPESAACLLNSGIPFKAGLGMLGFILIEVGYDATNSFARSWVLTCSSRPEHTTMLVLGLVMASLGGVSTAALGVVDFQFVSGILSVDGSSDNAIPQYEDLSDNSKKSNSGQIESVRDEDFRVSSERRPILPELSSRKNNKTHGAVEKDPSSTYGSWDPLVKPVTPEVRDASWNEKAQEREAYRGRSVLSICANQGVMCTMALICIGMWQGTGATYMFTMLSSDYVGKAIYGGNPRANAGTDSLTDYQDGVSMASWGFIVYYSQSQEENIFKCTLKDAVVSEVHMATGEGNSHPLNSALFLQHCRLGPAMADLFQRLCHSVPGYKVEFVCMQLVLAGLFVSLALTARLEAFFVLSAAAGAHRAIICSVPYAAANDVMQAEAERAKNSGSPRVGLAMAVVTGMMPLAYLTLFPWVGHLETLTGVVSLSPWLGAGFACLAAVFFMPAVI
ncbi:hypothetical protein BaRGS_00010074, partial [Batillaria attramentaria]